ncbi:hypothetical protein DEU56DRAFT_211452 [Suillus clintonianus]|uniref:uncharacterized protein n=1 Tax=Suillus clintonianus TaxID=1904413 RepID=UPI001B882C33|nr:uncharacterized protein DEU56DRAFT_211452 [Suillus clintonianus]KAG2144619.1 hypothetical protein DEU56DRAFT_211452 [Suillus clintonianus]
MSLVLNLAISTVSIGLQIMSSAQRVAKFVLMTQFTRPHQARHDRRLRVSGCHPSEGRRSYLQRINLLPNPPLYVRPEQGVNVHYSGCGYLDGSMSALTVSMSPLYAQSWQASMS